MKLHWQILTALVLGIVCGILTPGINPYTAWMGELFMNLLSMLMVPIILFSIVTSITSIYDSGYQLKRLGIKTFGYYIVTMVIAILTGFFLVNLIQPGHAVDMGSNAIVQANFEQSSVKDIVMGFVPKNIFEAFSKNSTIPVILIAFLIGLSIPKISQEGQQALNGFFKGGLEITLRITRLIIRLSPIGIFAIVVKQFGANTGFPALLQVMLLYVLTVLAGLFIHTFVWLPLILRFGFHVNPAKHLKNMTTPLLTAFSTASSGATIPLTLYAVEHKNGVSSGICNFTIPLGATINMNGAALLECVAVICIAQAYGVELSILQQMLIVVTSLLCAIGSAGIPMAALVMMALILNVVGLPLEGIGLVVGVDRILDMARTAVNVYGDTCVAVMVAKSEGERLTIDL
ncbi:MAG: dicarboxylate/amino acid:cation symporter [Candidatus Symbiothrix sp.]|jgi:Na+/H+-dicarboxylate symporter|nr:dicarboxylate/amino acid:cation symporter [Candidatus Symbiothrix sp.]